MQRVLEAKVEVGGEVKSNIKRGYLLLVGISNEDNEAIADKMIEKIAKLRLFEDSEGKTNLSIGQAQGEVLVVSQFTLYADCKKGNRPSFVNAGSPDMAKELYEYILKRCKEFFVNTEGGVFGADMKVTLINDGPFTIVLDSQEIVK